MTSMSNRLIGASIHNTKPEPVHYKRWFEHRDMHGLHYSQVYQKLDELTFNGYTPFQILKILELGESEYEKAR